MKKITTTVFAVLLSAPFFISNAQASTDYYSIVTLKGSEVRDILSNPSFSYLDFSYQKLDNNVYSLVANAKDENGGQLGSEISLTALTSPPPRSLKNLKKGYLRLDLRTMQDHNVDGSEDYVLTPKKCKDKDGTIVDYVSYRFSNKVSNASRSLSINPIIEFDLNPSPPY